MHTKTANPLPHGTSLPSCSGSQRNDLVCHIFEKYEADLRRFVQARGLTRPDCDDLIQEVFLRLASQSNLSEKLKAGSVKHKAYLITIAANLLCDMWRRSNARQVKCYINADEVNLVDTTAMPEDCLHAQQTVSAAGKVLASLDVKCRKAFVMSRFHGLSYSEIAEEMSVSVSMIEKYVAKALVAIRSRIDYP